jgi:hypothetical protein
MSFNKPVAKYFAIVVAIVFMLQVVGCGTIIYPERRGQTSGRIDVGIAVLDGLGLLLFIIPGVIAFAVDFSTGAIYLPHGKSRASNGLEDNDMTVVKVSPDDLNLAKLDEIILEHTGEKVDLDSDTVLIYPADDDVSVDKQLREISH